MRVFKLHAEGYIDPATEFEYKHIMNYRETFPLVHDHDYYEFFLILEGSIRHFVNRQSSILGRGHMVFIRPADVHSYHYHKEDCHFINLAILQSTVEDLLAYLGKGLDPARLLEPSLPPTLLLTGRELSEVVGLFENLNTLPVYDKLRLNLELRCILVTLFSRFFIIRNQEDDLMPEWMGRVITQMKEPSNFKEGTKAIKKIAYKSEEHISRSFKKYLNLTPTQFVNELRLNFAANQIRFTTQKINQIAYDAGFENLSNFHRQFKRMFQITPSDFRKANQRFNLENHSSS